ncbi:MAG: CotH kinase family protein [Bacteroidota bacterium]
MTNRFFIISLFLAVLFSANSVLAQQIVLNEMMASNALTISDEDGDHKDWIEIFNPTNQAVDLLNFGLSDNPEEPFRWTFPQVTLQPEQYLIIWASGKDRKIPGAPLHTNFSIRASGEDIVLTHSSGAQLDNIPPTQLPSDVSIGRNAASEAGWYFFNEPTPGEGNTSQVWQGITPTPVFSHQGGFYTNAFELTIGTAYENTQVYYTLDGALPTFSSDIYTENITIACREGDPNTISMIPTNNNDDPGPPYFEGWQPPAGEIFKVNVVRAMAVKENFLPSKVETHSYLVDELGVNRYSLPVFFINTNEEHFFDHYSGIYIPGEYNNMFQRGREWERPINIAFFEKDGTLGFSDDMGVRIHGGTTRSRPRKSLRIYSRDEYGQSWLNYQLFPEKGIQQYKRFLLRNSGNDWDQSVFRDGFMQYLARDLNLETQYYRPAIVFLNGEYWGIHNIRDRYDKHYIYSHYGLEEHEMTVLQRNAELAYGNPDGVHHYNQMVSFIGSNNMADNNNYAHVQSMMDTRSYIDERITGIYVMNTDWPGNNINFFRRLTDGYDPMAAPGLDGRWRWHILDTDFGFWLNFFYVPGVDEGAAHNTLAFATETNGPSWPNPPWSTFLLRSLLENNNFKNDFINRFADLLNTTLRAENVVAVIDSIEAKLQPEMQEHIDRWRRPTTLNEWHENIQRMRTFAQQRTDYQRQHIRQHFNLAGEARVELSANEPGMGDLRINTIWPDISSPWAGIYFKGIPIEVQAVPRPGYRFSHWSGATQQSHATIKIVPEGDISLTAHFEINPGFEGDELNPPAWPLVNGSYFFESWNAQNPEESFPPNMLFLQSSKDDPKLFDAMTHRYHIPSDEYHEDDLDQVGFPYNLTRRTRLNGLGAQGISFINTGRERDLGAAVLAIDTREMEDITVAWTGGTVVPNARVYAIRLQYKIGPDGFFTDVVDEEGNVVEYQRSENAGHEQHFGPLLLPDAVNNQEYVQLRWKYYFTGEQIDTDHGRRDMLRLDNIRVSTLTTNILPDQDTKQSLPVLFQNHPNPATETTSVSFALPAPADANLILYDATGRMHSFIAKGHYPTGTHTITFSTADLTPGLYVYRLVLDGFSTSKKMFVR